MQLVGQNQLSRQRDGARLTIPFEFLRFFINIHTRSSPLVEERILARVHKLSRSNNIGALLLLDSPKPQEKLEICPVFLLTRQNQQCNLTFKSEMGMVARW